MGLETTISWNTLPPMDSHTEPPKNSNSEKLSSNQRLLKILRSTPTQRTPSPLDTTSCPPGLMLSTRKCSEPLSQRTSLLRTSPNLIPSTSQPPSIGDNTEPSTPSRTKDNVDHAGLSLPLLPLKDTTPSNKDNSFLLPSNNTLIATLHAMDAEVDGNQRVCNTFNKTDKPLSKTIPTLPEMEHAELPK